MAVSKLARSTVFRCAQGRCCACGLSLSHTAYRVSRGHVCPMVGGYHHTGYEQVLDTRHAQRPVRDSVCAAVFDLIAWSRIVKAVHEDIVIKVSALNDIFVRYVIVAGNSLPRRMQSLGLVLAINAFSQPGTYFLKSSTALAMRFLTSSSALAISSLLRTVPGTLKLHLMNIK